MRFNYRLFHAYDYDGRVPQSPVRDLESYHYEEVHRGSVGPQAIESGVVPRMSVEQAAEHVFHVHRQEERPDGWRIRAVSVCDIVEIEYRQFRLTPAGVQEITDHWGMLHDPSWPSDGPHSYRIFPLGLSTPLPDR